MKKTLIQTAKILGLLILIIGLPVTAYTLYSNINGKLYRLEMVNEELRSQTPEAMLADIREKHKNLKDENDIYDKEIDRMTKARDKNSALMKELELKSHSLQFVMNTGSIDTGSLGNQ